MSAKQRLGFLAAAVLIAVVAVVLLAGGPDEQTNVADQTPATATNDATPEAAETETPEAAETETPTPTPTAEPPETVRFADGEVVGGLARLRFEKGERARFRVASDVADEVHVHGYDISREVRAGGSVTFSFRADIEGIFEVELESRGAQLAQLRVEP